MPLKDWMLGKVNGVPKPRTRGAPPRGASGADASEPVLGDPAEPLGRDRSRQGHLGPYEPLIAAIREALERFADTQLRLHLAIAERDRYVLTAIEVDCDDGPHRDLLRRFATEFKPEQIKHYVARELIAGLRNASAIDLSQFAGLEIARSASETEADDGYAALIAELRTGAPGAEPHPFRIELSGRWSQADSRMPAVGVARMPRGEPPAAVTPPSTPVAGRSCALEIDDGKGRRTFEIPAIVAGRRYVVGKDSRCDVVVDGVFASRRHCEIWLDHGAWWVADAGSTNGIRVESPKGGRVETSCADRGAAVALEPDSVLVLSAQGQGNPGEYPRLSLRTAGAEARPEKPIATPIAPPVRGKATWTIGVKTPSGVREVAIGGSTLPFGIGRSRNQGLVVDPVHAEVSGRHLEIVAIDDDGASVVVHGDNGVVVEGRAHAPGARFRWKSGETLALGRGGGASACTLTLSRAS